MASNTHEFKIDFTATSGDATADGWAFSLQRLPRCPAARKRIVEVFVRELKIPEELVSQHLFYLRDGLPQDNHQPPVGSLYTNLFSSVPQEILMQQR